MKDFNGPLRHLEEQLAGIRPGNIGIGFVETFRHEGVELGTIASVFAVADRIHVAPHDRSKVDGIAKSLVAGGLGAFRLNPATICVPVPPMSGEQKTAMAKHIKKLGEEARVALRFIRMDAKKAACDDRKQIAAIDALTCTVDMAISAAIDAKIAAM